MVEVEYENLTIAGLKELMDGRGIRYTTRMRKAELISEIRQDDRDNENRANDADAATTNNRRANNSNNTNRGAEGGAPAAGLIVNGTVRSSHMNIIFIYTLHDSKQQNSQPTKLINELSPSSFIYRVATISTKIFNPVLPPTLTMFEKEGV